MNILNENKTEKMVCNKNDPVSTDVYIGRVSINLRQSDKVIKIAQRKRLSKA